MTRMPLKGHPYHDKTDDQLKYIIKDAGEAAQAMRGMNDSAENKYLDQVNDASTILHYRKNVKGNSIMKEDIQAMLAAIVGPNKDYQQGAAMFNNIMVSKVQSAIENAKIEVADKMFNGNMSEDVSIKGHPGSTYHDEGEEVRGNKAPHKDAGDDADDETVPSKKGGEQKAPLAEEAEELNELSVKKINSYITSARQNSTFSVTGTPAPGKDRTDGVRTALLKKWGGSGNFPKAKVPATDGKIVSESRYDNDDYHGEHDPDESELHGYEKYRANFKPRYSGHRPLSRDKWSFDNDQGGIDDEDEDDKKLNEMATKAMKSTKEMEVGDQCNARGAGARAKGKDTITPHVVVAKDKKNLYIAPRQATMNGGHATAQDLVDAHASGKLVKNVVAIPHGSEEIEHSTGGRGAPFKAKSDEKKSDSGVALQNIFAKWGAK